MKGERVRRRKVQKQTDVRGSVNAKL